MLHLFFLIKNIFMTLEMNLLLSINNTSEKSFESKLFNLFSFRQISDPDLNFFNDHSEAVS